MGIPLIQVDAFADRPFAGNPAAVCLLDGPRDAAWMQAVGQEMNLSETAFLEPHPDGFGLRWFTPKVEIELCGHATLAGAHVLWEVGRLAPEREARFHTKSGLLTARRAGDWIELDFPARPEHRAPPPEGLFAALGIVPATVEHVGRVQSDYLVHVREEGIVRALAPDHGALKRVSLRGVMVTAPGGGDFDFVSRFFAPGAGIEEDPVTGAAHCCLGPYWARRLRKTDLLAFQASARGGVLRVRPEGERVKLAGQAVTVLRGELV
jgi:PhzF family phenazine biosynthesis protein